MKYPYVVIRWMAAVYGSRDVIIDTDIRDQAKGSFLLPPDAVLQNGQIADSGRKLLLDQIMRDVVDSGFRMCAVFGPSDCVFIEPDGTFKVSKDPPSGGIAINDVKLTGAPKKSNTQ